MQNVTLNDCFNAWPNSFPPLNHTDSCKSAKARGILLNTIHCGDERTGVDTMWRDGARLADGRFLVIDQDHAVAYIEAPQDKEIAKLSSDLNGTYLAYGRAGWKSSVRREMQDRNAATVASSGALVARAVAKSSANYNNGNRDLVDAAKDKDFKLEALKKTNLLAAMQTLPPAERKEFVEKKSKERSELQAKVNTPNAAREKFVAAKMKQVAASNTLDSVVITIVREQTRTREFKFERAVTRLFSWAMPEPALHWRCRRWRGFAKLCRHPAAK